MFAKRRGSNIERNKDYKNITKYKEMAHLVISHPSSILLSGPSGSGKSFWMKRLVEHAKQMFSPSIDKVTLCYAEMQPLYNEMNVDLLEGMPANLCDQLNPELRHLVIVDDMMTELGDSTLLANFFTKICHHRGISLIVINQSLFPKGKESRTMSLNANYIVCFKHPRDQSQIMHLARQIYPGRSKFLLEAFNDATSKAYGYIVLDFRPETLDDRRVRTHVFPDDDLHYCYVSKT